MRGDYKMKLLLYTLPIAQALREIYFCFFFPIAAVDILGHQNEAHNTSERHFFSFLFGEATAQSRQ